VIRRVVIEGGLAAGLALLLAGCGSGLNTNGPFGNRDNSSFAECLPVPPRDVATIAATEFPNTGGRAQIDKVTLVGAHNLRLVADQVLPITGTDPIGVFSGYPPLGLKGYGPPVAGTRHPVGATPAR
jgi:hypothetical protein